MLAILSFSFTHLADETVLRRPSSSRFERAGTRRRGDEQHPAGAATGGRTPRDKAEIIRINTHARHIALQVALSFRCWPG